MLGLTPISGSPISSLQLQRPTALIARLQAVPRFNGRMNETPRYRATIRTIPSDGATRQGTN